jgi:hypothetical protein
MLRRLTIACSALIALAGNAFSQDARLLVPGVDTLATYLIRGTDTMRTGTVIDEISIDTASKERVVRRVYRSSDEVLGQRVDTLIDAFPSLAPRAHRSRSSRTLEFLEFATGRASGWIRLVNGDSVSVDRPIDPGVVNASSLDLVLRTSPLSPTWQATINTFIASMKAAVPMHARVDGEEAIRGRAAWRVRADFAGTPVTFWIDKKSRALLRQVMRLGVDVEILFAPPTESSPKRRAT